ncbi:MAG: inositol monophosphatase family protein [Microbacteriaceae bacterium]
MTSSPSVSTSSLQRDLELALQLADAAAETSLSRFQALDLEVMTKPDRSPVTDADRATEQAIRSLLAEHRPEDAIFGEEFEAVESQNNRQWIIDPIDGTANFLRGNPIWGTLIALAVDGYPVLGVASLPALGRRFWAAKGLGSWSTNALLSPNAAPKRSQVSGVHNIADAAISFPRMNGWIDAGYSAEALQLNSEAWRTVGGSDLWSFCLVAEGVADAVIEFDLQPYDIAALIPIVEEAGGYFSGIHGDKGQNQSDVIASTPGLHQDLISRFDAKN